MLLPTSPDALAELWRERRQRIVVRNRLTVRMERLDADMAGTGVEMSLDALVNCRLGSPSHHSVKEPIAAAAI
jgi:hypothetical protein